MEYKKVKYREIGKIKSGKRLPKGFSVTEKITNNKYIRVRDLNNNILDINNIQYITDEACSYIKDYRVKEDDIIISVVGTIGNIAKIPKELQGAYLTENCNNLLVDEKFCLKEYLKYYLISDYGKNEINAHIVGSTQPKLPIYGIQDFNIILPSTKYQMKIIKILNSLDKKIELNNKINDNLLKLNDELYEKYFIDNVEENTATIELKNLITVVNGYSYKGNELAEKSNIGMATIKNFERKGGFKEEGFKALNPSKLKLEQIVEINDILVACTDLTQQADIIGNAILLLGKAEFEKIVISMDLVKIIPKEGINKFIVYSILNSKEFKNFALGYKSGTTVLHLNKKCFNDFKIKLPNEDILKKFSIIVENNYKKISNIIEENRRLEKLRDTLLPKLMNGEIDLDKIEI